MGGASLVDVAGWLSDRSGVAFLTAALAPFVWLTLPVFAVGVLLSTSTDRLNPWGVLGVIAVAMQNAVFSIVIATDTILAVRADTLLETPQLTAALWDLHTAFFTLNGVSIALALGAFSAATLVSGKIPRWFAALGFLGAASFLANALQLPAALVGDETPIGIVAGLIWVVWAAGLAGSMVRRPRRTGGTSAAPA